MAVKFIGRITFSIAAIIIIGTVLIFLGRSRDSGISDNDTNKFIKTFIELSIAKETHFYNQDSIRANYESIFEESGVDSVWIAEFTEKLSNQPDKQKQIWLTIVSRLDSLRENVASDTIRSFQSKSPVNADSM